MTEKQKRQRAKKMISRNLKLREQLWPDLIPEELWDRINRDGFTTMPRTMLQILHIMDGLAPKGQPVSLSYLSLWCRVFDESFIKIQNPLELASESGFSGQRALTTWNSRMKHLVELGFIDAKEGPWGKYSFVLIINPYIVIKKKFEAGEIPEPQYNALFVRAQDVGATDLEE